MCGKTKKLNFIHPAFCLGVWRKTLCPRLPYYSFLPSILPSFPSIASAAICVCMQTGVCDGIAFPLFAYARLFVHTIAIVAV